MEVAILNRQRVHPIDCKELEGFLQRVARIVPADGVDSLAVCLVSDRKMRQYNRKFRGRDAATDVLSFPGERVPGPIGENHFGDIVISVSSAARQAVGARHGLDHELKILALHGYLHLLGHDHDTDDGAMLELQSRLIRRLLRPATQRNSP